MSEKYRCVGGNLDGHYKPAPQPGMRRAEFLTREATQWPPHVLVPGASMISSADNASVAVERVLYVLQNIDISEGGGRSTFYVWTPEGQTLAETWAKLIEGYRP